MSDPLITLDLNQPCAVCGSPGRVVEDPAGRCRICLAAGAASPDPAPPAFPAPPRRANAYLAARLADLVDRATRADRRFRSITLRGGLQIEVGLGTEFNLRLSRAGVAPSAIEWRTVVDHLPARVQPAAAVLPRDVTQAGRVYLEAHWPIIKETHESG